MDVAKELFFLSPEEITEIAESAFATQKKISFISFISAGQ